MEYNKKTGKWESNYWHPALTTDAVVFGFDKDDSSLQILLIKRGKAKKVRFLPLRASGLCQVDLFEKTNQQMIASKENC